MSSAVTPRVGFAMKPGWPSLGNEFTRMRSPLNDWWLKVVFESGML